MNGNCSTTGYKSPERLPDAATLECQWKSIDWKKAKAEVNRLQARIAKATQEKKWNTVKRLQYLLTHSYYAKALAVRKVTTNKGKNTPGVDKELWKTPASKMRGVLTLTDKGYKAKPLRRVYIEKKGKRAKRPLGIPCMYDRAMQALYALSLDPVSETTADTKSFGFRRGRCAQDACEYIFTALNRSFSPQWVLEGDIKGCFDHINHDWLIEHIPMDKSVLKQFLKAGFIFQDQLFPTDEGTPQGGVISPILANMTLDGLQDALTECFATNGKGHVCHHVQSRNRVNLVRYADDFIVTAATREIAESSKEIIRDFLRIRGLELSEEKTVISHIEDGFDMLGWTFRKFKGKLITKPSKKAIKAFSASLSETILRRGKAWPQDLLIFKLNQQIRGWVNYHQSVCAKDAFSHIDYILFQLLWRWAKRRHPKKNYEWIARKYWHSKGGRNWVFSAENNQLLSLAYTPITRHTKVRMDANPYFDTQYFIDRKFQHGMKRLSGRYKQVWKNQHGCCYYCGLPMDISDEREIFFKIPKSMGGKDEVRNMAYVHKHCQQIFLERRAKAL
ncbi:group II intron reverse transcriptase/maturase [Pseudoflavonifractor phocaeensis]|uniref:group II intron reverse transcriptase/maturase n=1 Tax=Pseudoflavonifractor phocaeensis TaxID=1870988 RepID=UPI0019564B03|nr:group II intron reverse transcriptase/maturase [Pseudoflavonifractor phocaeensis]MBM6725392.1 group II intron reverse transcriptase/maturase [Pseudoflavonifractor phocaeensis]